MFGVRVGVSEDIRRNVSRTAEGCYIRGTGASEYMIGKPQEGERQDTGRGQRIRVTGVFNRRMQVTRIPANSRLTKDRFFFNFTNFLSIQSRGTAVLPDCFFSQA